MTFDWSSAENALLLNPRLPVAEMARFEEAWRELVAPSLKAHIGIATSGSSGEEGGARLIAISKPAMLAAAEGVNRRLEASASDIWLRALPEFHVGGLAISARARLSGSSVVSSRLERWNAHAFHSELEDTRATLVSLVPTQLFDLVQAGLRGSKSLRAVIVGGGRLEEALRQQAVRLGWPALPSYGLTECGSMVAIAVSPSDPRMKPLSHVELRIGAENRIELRSHSLLTGFISFADGAPKFVDPKLDGWLTTSDRGALGDEGEVIVHGRTLDFVKIGGEGVVLSKLEETLEHIRLHRGFSADAALLATADERLGARIVLVSSADELATKALADEFNASVMPFERVRSLHHLSVLPRSPLGKLLRMETLAAIGLEPLADA